MAFEVRTMVNTIEEKITPLRRWITRCSSGTAAVMDADGTEGGNETDTFEPLTRRVIMS